MPAAWSNPNFRGAGQNIVVMDTGVQSNHEFFRDSMGISRVFFEACFGTNGSLPNGTQFSSACPLFQQDANGDSPGGLPGSAAPCGGNLALSSSCSHGTQVAGIAAGRASTNPLMPPPPELPAQFQGVAPDALTWPACVPKVIKVSSVVNNSCGNTRSPQANLANPSAFPGE